MYIGIDVYWLLIIVLTLLITVFFIWFATIAFWSNSPFRNQHSYDRWFVSNLENSAGAGYELGSSYGLLDDSKLDDSKLGAVCPLTQGPIISDPAFNNCISTI